MQIVVVLALVVGIPVAYLFIVTKRILARDTCGVPLSLLFFAATAVTAVWAIGQSRAGWADIGYVGVPVEAALAAFLALPFRRLKNAPIRSRRILAWLSLAASVLIVVFNVAQGTQIASANRADDAYDEAQFGQFTRDENLIAGALKQNPGRERAWLDSSIRTRMNDSVFLSVALANDSISPGLLDTLTGSRFQPVALRAISNQGTSGETLARIFRAHSDSDLFVHAVAANHHTPSHILREIYRRPHNTNGIEISLAGNPATPRDVLRGLARSATYPETIQMLLRRETLDCPLLREVAAYLAGKGQPLARDYNVARLNEVTPKLCSGSAGK
ncbi:MAG TPA: hypothetical protein VF836_04270 [Gemmatimonadaceae bacterium]